ncbi:hypothetical protein INR49_022817 [Caranx melampygus]|nr:hypothetical protein INR49_022817 [Caranx melampygus]
MMPGAFTACQQRPRTEEPRPGADTLHHRGVALQSLRRTCGGAAEAEICSHPRSEQRDGRGGGDELLLVSVTALRRPAAPTDCDPGIRKKASDQFRRLLGFGASCTHLLPAGGECLR